MHRERNATSTMQLVSPNSAYALQPVCLLRCSRSDPLGLPDWSPKCFVSLLACFSLSPPRLVGCIHETGAVLAGATRVATETRNYGDGNYSYSLRRPLVPSQQSQSLHLTATAVASGSRRRGDSGVGRSALAWGARVQGVPAAWRRGATWESLGARRSIWTPKG